MKDTYVDGEKLARNGRKTASYYSASFPPQYRGTLLSTLVSFSVNVRVEEIFLENENAEE